MSEFLRSGMIIYSKNSTHDTCEDILKLITKSKAQVLTQGESGIAFDQQA